MNKKLRSGTYPSTNLDDYGIVYGCQRNEVDHLVKAHYLHRWPGVVVMIASLRRNEQTVGVLVFALPPRETMKRYKVSCAWELARLFIFDSEPFNTESWFIAKAIKHIKIARPEVELLVSYADPSRGHAGIIYKASNWTADGRTDEGRKTPRFDYKVGNKVYSRRAHVPVGAKIERVPRVSKWRFIYRLKKNKI